MLCECEKLQLKTIKYQMQRMEKDELPYNIILISATVKQAKVWKREIAKELEVPQKDLFIISSNPNTQDGINWRDSIVLFVGKWWENPGVTNSTLCNIRESVITRQIVL